MSTTASALKKSKKKDADKKRLSRNLFDYCRQVSVTASYGNYDELVSLFKVDLETQKHILIHKILPPEMEQHKKLGFLDKATIDSFPEVDLLYVVIKTCTTKDKNKIVKFLTQKTVEIFGRERIDKLSRDGATALHAATHFGNAEMIQDLISAGASVNIKAVAACNGGLKNSEGATPLIMACIIGSLESVKVLCEVHGIDIDAKDDASHSALQYAARNGHAEIIKFLHERKANMSCTNTFGSTPLMYAAAFGQQKALEELLKIPVVKANINQKNAMNRTALHYIFNPTEDYDTIPARIAKQQTPLGKSLAKMGADPLMFEKQSTLVSIAKQKAVIGQMLLKLGADPTALDNKGVNGIMLAIGSANTLLVIAFLNYLSSFPKTKQQEILNYRTEHGDSALTTAVQSNDLTIVKLVVKACKVAEANLNITNFNGQTALHLSATKWSSVEILQFLVDAGVSINLQNDDGTTPVSIAACHGQVDKLKLLQERGADMNIPNLFGATPLLQSIVFNQAEALKYLLENTNVKLTGIFKIKLSKLAFESVKREHLLPTEKLESEREIIEFLRKNMKIYKNLIDRGLYEKEMRCLLSETIAYGSVQMLEYLLQASKKLSQSERRKFLRGTERENPLLEAAYHGKTQMLSALIKAGANLTDTDEMGRNFLMMLVYGFKKIDKLSEDADYTHVGKCAVVTCQSCADKNLAPMVNPMSRLKSILSTKHSGKEIFAILQGLNPIIVNYLFQSTDKQGNTAIQYAINLICDEAVSVFWQYNPALFKTEYLISFLEPSFKAKCSADRHLKARYETLLMTLIWNKTMRPLLEYNSASEELFEKLINAHSFLGNYLALNYDHLLCDESGALIFAVPYGRKYVAAKISDKDIVSLVSAIHKLGDPVGPINSVDKSLEKKMVKILLNYVPEIAQKNVPKTKEQILQAELQAEALQMISDLKNEYKSFKEWIQKVKQDSIKLLEVARKALNLSISHLETGVYYARAEDKHRKDQNITCNNAFKKELDHIHSKILGENGRAIEDSFQKLESERALNAINLQKEVYFKSLLAGSAGSLGSTGKTSDTESKKEKEKLAEILNASKIALIALREEYTGHKNSLLKTIEDLKQQLENQERDYRNAKSSEKTAAKLKSRKDKKKKKKEVYKTPLQQDLQDVTAVPALASTPAITHRENSDAIPQQVFRSGPTELSVDSLALSTTSTSIEHDKFAAEQDLKIFIEKYKPKIKSSNDIPERLSHYEQSRREEDGPTTLTLDSMTEASAISFVMDQKIHVKELLAVKTPNDELAFLKHLALSAAAGQLLEKLKDLSRGLLTPAIARHIRNVIFHGKVPMNFSALSTMLTRLMDALSSKKESFMPGESLIDFLNSIDPPSLEEPAVISSNTVPVKLGLLAKLALTDINEENVKPGYYEQELLLAMQHLEQCKLIYLKDKNCNLKLLRTAVGSLFAELGTAISRLQNSYSNHSNHPVRILKKEQDKSDSTQKLMEERNVSSRIQGDLQLQAREILNKFMEKHIRTGSGGLLEGLSLKDIRNIGNKVRHANTFKPQYGRDFRSIRPWQEDIEVFIAKQFMSSSSKQDPELLVMHQALMKTTPALKYLVPVSPVSTSAAAAASPSATTADAINAESTADESTLKKSKDFSVSRKFY